MFFLLINFSVSVCSSGEQETFCSSAQKIISETLPSKRSPKFLKQATRTRKLPRKCGSLESNTDKFSTVLLKTTNFIFCNYLFTCLTVRHTTNNSTLIDWSFNLKNDLDSCILEYIFISVLLTLLLKSVGNELCLHCI